MAVHTCERCGFSWQDAKKYQRKFCDECIPIQQARTSKGATEPNWDNVLNHVDLRLANEMAVSLLKMGRPKAALQVLEAVPARARTAGTPPAKNRGATHGAE